MNFRMNLNISALHLKDVASSKQRCQIDSWPKMWEKRRKKRCELLTSSVCLRERERARSKKWFPASFHTRWPIDNRGNVVNILQSGKWPPSKKKRGKRCKLEELINWKASETGPKKTYNRQCQHSVAMSVLSRKVSSSEFTECDPSAL